MGNRSMSGSPYIGAKRNRYSRVRPASDFGNSAKALSIQGFDEIIRNLNIEILKITNGSKVGLIQVAKFIRRTMAVGSENQNTIPLDKGPLRASWETHQITEGTKHGIVMGFSANYALWVHEMVDPGIKWSEPGSGPKFLEQAIANNKDEILQILISHAKV